MVSSEVRPPHAQNADPAEKCGRRPSVMRMTLLRAASKYCQHRGPSHSLLEWA
jgi:hypothetical protein